MEFVMLSLLILSGCVIMLANSIGTTQYHVDIDAMLEDEYGEDGMSDEDAAFLYANLQEEEDWM